MPENGGEKETQLAGAANTGALSVLPLTLSSVSIHFVCSTIFRLFWSSGNCVCGEHGSRARVNGEENGDAKIYCRQLRSNFGKPLNVSYQYASDAVLCANFAGIILLFFSIRRRVAKLNMKINKTFFSFRAFKYLLGKLILNSLSELREIIYAFTIAATVKLEARNYVAS